MSLSFFQLLKLPQFIIFITVFLIAGILTAQKQFALEDSADSKLFRSRQTSTPELIRLQSELKTAKRDTNCVILLNKLSGICTLYDSLYEPAVMYSERAWKLSEEINYSKGLVNAIKARGYVEEIIKNDWGSAVVYYQKAIATAKNKKLDDTMLDTLFSIIHNTYVYQGNFPMAMAIANEGLEKARRRNDRMQILHYTSLVAASYFRQNLFEKSLAEYKKAEILAESFSHAENSSEEEKMASFRLVNIADIYYGLAEVYMAVDDTAKAIYFLDKAFTKFVELKKDSSFKRGYMISNSLYKKGIAAMILGDYANALNYSLASLDSCKNWGCNPYEKVGYYLLAGDILRRQGKYDEAESYLYQGKQIAEKIRHAENARDVYYYLSLFYADKKMFDSAWYYNRLHTLLKDSITNERTRFRTEEINTIYGIAEKDRQIARQNNVRNILIASFLVLLLTLWFLYNRYRLRQRNRYQQQLNRQQNELFNAIALAQEQERKRIAHDIHDSLGSVLSAAKLKLAEVKDGKPELGSDEKFLSGIGLLDEASAELRNISYNIMPATLSKLGMVPALKSLTEKISSYKGVQIKFIAHDFENRMDEQTEISIYRIVLELINNVVKHAGATKATVQLVRYPDHINITVEDNGKGFDIVKTSEEKPGIGLGSVASRVEYLKGKMDIDTMEGGGTTVVVDIPVSV